MKKSILVFIFLVAAVLRLWQLGAVPPSPDWDEVALGFNAYSIMQTGRDEYGTFLPIVLRSFDDYKPALYAYLAIPSIAVFGLSTIAVRLPSALLGLLTVVAAYFLVKELFKRWEIAALVSFLLAISPWHIQFSRIAFESNIGLACNIFAALFFVKGLKRPFFLFFSAAFAAMSLYIYQSEKVFTPLFILLLATIFRKEVLAIGKKYLFAAVFFGAIMSFPLVYYTLTNTQALTRAKGVSVFSSDNQYLNDYSVRNLVNREKGDFAGLLLDNRRVLYAKFVIDNYLSHYNFYWLFLSGDENRHHAPEMGLLYLWELPFLLVGIYSLLFGSWDKRVKLFIFGWFLLAPIAASVTTGVPHAVRTLNFLPTFQIFTGIGIIFTMQKISHIRLKYLLFSFYFLFLIFNFVYYLNQYFVQQNYFYSQAWQYGYKELVSYVKTIENRYDRIVVSNEPHLDQSYMFFLFYLAYPPGLYQKESGNLSGGFAETHNFGKYEFRPIKWDEEQREQKTLFIGRPADFLFKAAPVLRTIYFLDGEEAIKVVEG